ncbi:MAG: exopolysaccharide biosynthesis protein [Solirubrobacteraceae bacterium]
MPAPAPVEPVALSDQLERWLKGDGARTLGSLVHTFGDKSFAILLVLLLAVPALPLPTGGVTHVFEVIAALIALELIAGRHEVWLPERWRELELSGSRQQRFIAALMRLIRRLERHSRPRMRFLLDRRFTDIVFGLLAIAGIAGAFLAPPFSGLDTLPALGVVVLSLGVLLEDALIALVGIVLAATGIALELALGAAAVHGISSIL